MTNTVSTSSSIAQETINSVLIDMLKGASSASAEIYTAGKEGLVKAVDFAQEQAPIVVQEFLTWNFSQSIIWIIISTIILFAIGWIFKKSIESLKDIDKDGPFALFGMVFAPIFFLFLLFNTFIPNVETAIKIKVAPRIYMIEWVGDQIKK